MELVGRSATDLAAAVHAGEVSAVEVIRAHIDQLAAVEHRLGAFVSTRRRHALDEAEALDARSDLGELPLAGVPVAISDVIDVAGEPTRYGSLATSSEPAERDHPVVAVLRAAGAIVLGKTRCSELEIWGTSDDAAGNAVSPWDPTRTAGGSSGGSAAAVSAGIVPIALGADGMGSVRSPAAACGAVGIKPGAPYAMQEVDGEPGWFGMGRYGPITTTVADAALALDVVAGTGHLREIRPLPGELKVAVSWRPSAPGVVVTSAWREAAIEAGRLLNHAGHEVKHDDPPYDRAGAQAAVARWTQGVGAYVAELGLDVDQLQPRTRAHLAAGERLARVAPVREEQATRWRERVARFFEEYDVLITPAFARAQPAADAWHTKPWAANLAANLSAYPFFAPWNLADQPAAVVPLWEDGGRPLSVQIVAGPGGEELVLSVAAGLESMVPWRRHAPGWGVDGADSA